MMTLNEQKVFENIPLRYRWRLEDIYENEQLMEKDIIKLKDMLCEAKKYKGRLKESPSIFLECLKLRDSMYRLMDKIYVYSHLKRDIDNNSAVYQVMAGHSEKLNIDIEREFSFIEPEIIAMPSETLEAFFSSSKELNIYRHYIDNIMRLKGHILSAGEESIAALSADAFASENIYRALCLGDMAFPSIIDEKGQKIELSEGKYQQLLKSGNREVRKNAFTALYGTYNKYKNTFSAILNGAVKKDVFYAKIKGYNSSIEASLHEDNIPEYIYENVINTINSNLDPLRRYMTIKKKILGIDVMHMYDIYVPAARYSRASIPYDECVGIIMNGLKPLGYEYIKLLSLGFSSRWVDVFGYKGKTGGAYSWGAYDTHPYIKLNYSGTMEDVLTLAHEMGHSIHSYLTRRAQPYIHSHYSLFTGEFASIVNEAILLKVFLEKTADRNKRKFLLYQFIDNIYTSVYRQAMFSEFEDSIHRRVEEGSILTADYLCSLWHGLNEKYYGPDIFIDDEIDIEWARISHFYWDYYVYKYVTGYGAAICMAEKIMNEGSTAVEKYIKLLKSGDSDYPLELLKKAGVDMSSAEPLLCTVKLFEELVDKFEAICT